MFEFSDRWSCLSGATFEWRDTLPSRETASLEEVLSRYDRTEGLEFHSLQAWCALGEEPAQTNSTENSLFSLPADEIREGQLTVERGIEQRLVERFEGIEGNGGVRYGAEIDLTICRLFFNRYSNPLQVETVVSCKVLDGERESFIFFDSNWKHYMLQNPVLMRFHGKLDEVTSFKKMPDEILYSDMAFEELLEIASYRDHFGTDFNDLPRRVLNDIRHTIWLKVLDAGDMHCVDLGDYNRRIGNKRDTFIVDTLQCDRAFVKLIHTPSGTIDTEVRLKVEPGIRKHAREN